MSPATRFQNNWARSSRKVANVYFQMTSFYWQFQKTISSLPRRRISNFIRQLKTNSLVKSLQGHPSIAPIVYRADWRELERTRPRVFLPPTFLYSPLAFRGSDWSLFFLNTSFSRFCLLCCNLIRWKILTCFFVIAVIASGLTSGRPPTIFYKLNLVSTQILIILGI